MASSSTSSDPKTFKYEVFLSFRGVDTRYNFVAHLHRALKQESIVTFKDDKNMEKGERITTELIKAIEASRFYIIVFSKNYASSSWCLDELVKIMECQETTEQKAYPVFYDVEPTEVRKQIGAVGEAFAQHRMNEDAEKWRNALTKAAGLIGWDLEKTANGDQAKLIKILVKEISLALPSFKFSDVEKFVGMDDRIEHVLSPLKTGSNDIRMIGIKGMGGGGKTTLAKSLFDRLSDQFTRKSFVENVREKVSKDRLESVQNLVLLDVLKDKDIKVSGLSDGKLKMKKRMRDEEVLLVLDDVHCIEQLEALAEPSWFMPGSIIIITTRDEEVLIKYGMNSNSIHGVNLLSDEEAIRLFSWHAFGSTENPIPDQYEKLSRQVVHHAAGLPLTIRVLGLDLKGKDVDEWKGILKRLEKIPPKETLKQLEISYIGLENDYKDIFLDVACFWKGEHKEEAIRALESCQLEARTGLRALERKSLITVSKYGSLEMHDSIRDLGWAIVRREHPNDPERHSRLWINEEIENIFANDWGSEATRGIKVLWTEDNASIIMKGLKNMKKLRFLHVYTSCYYNFDSHRDGKFDEANKYFPNALQYLRWDKYPFSSLPITFEARNLVGLYMSGSNLVQLWEGGERKVLPKLRFFELIYSRLKTLDLGLTPDLDTLSITNCDSFKKLHMSAKCLKLKSLDISGSQLTTLDLEGTPNLETLRLHFSFDLVELQNLATCLKLKSIDIVSMIKLTTLDLEGTPNIETLRLDSHYLHLVEVKMPAKCRILKFLHISGSKLTTLDLEGALNLETLYLRGCSDLVELQMPAECPKLKTLNLSLSKLKTLRLRTPNLESLNLEECSDLVELHMLDECPKLTYLSLRHSKLRTFNLMWTPNLETLDLEGCYNLVKLDASIGCLKKITRLCLSGCLGFENFDFFKKPSFCSSELKLSVKSMDICPVHPEDINWPKF